MQALEDQDWHRITTTTTKIVLPTKGNDASSIMGEYKEYLSPP